MQKRRGEITRVGDLFEKYRTRLKAPEGSVISACIEVVHDLLGITLKKSTLRYNTRSRVLTLSVSGVIKTEVLMHKNEILTHLKGRLGLANAPKDIV